LWLRWFDTEGTWIPTSDEQAAQAKAEKEAALHQMAQERTEKEAALRQLEKLAAKLKELGIDPEQM
jgi:hypothetical protein